MVVRIAEHITKKLIMESIIEEGDKELYCYGFFLLFTRFFFLLVVVTIGFITDVWFESIVFYVVFMSLRSYAGGIHARTEKVCTIATTLVLIASVLVVKLLGMYAIGIASMLILGIGSLCILAFSPLDTSEKTLDEHEKRKYKAICFTILIICILISLIAWHYGIKSIFYPVDCGICLESVLLMLGKICSHRKSRNHIG